MRNASSSPMAACRALRKLGFSIVLAMASVLPWTPSGIAAPAPCVSTSVANQAAFDAAIADFNAERRACHHKITLTADIPLTTSTTAIDNNNGVTHAWLVIDGDGFSVEGDDFIRPFCIRSDTVVVMKRMTVTGVSDSHSNGGGISNAGKLTLNDCTVSNNRGEYGAGIYNSGTLTILNSTLSGNNSYEEGGGIYNTGTLTVKNSAFINQNSGPWCSGGGIYNTGTLTVSFSTFSNNGAQSAGGGIHNQGGTLTVTNSTFDHNEAGESGGGISNWSGTVAVTNSTISGNKAYFHSGGGIVNTGMLTLTNSTLSGNITEDDTGGGIANFGDLTLNNSIIANSMNGDCVNRDEGDVTAFYSLIEDTRDRACDLTNGANGNIVGRDPRLGRLKENGGPTKTHALLSKSPAIDKGNNHLAVDPDGHALETDQRGDGYPRILPGNFYFPIALSKRVDIGAYEYFNLKIIKAR
jgi:hypothetical protein